MTDVELVQRAPKLAALMQKLERGLTSMFAACGLDFDPHGGEVTKAELLVLAVFQELLHLRRDLQPPPTDGIRWEFVTKTLTGTTAYLIFKNDRNELAHLPADFVMAILRNETLSSTLVESPLEVGVYQVQRAGVTEAMIAASLLDHLLSLRRKDEVDGLLKKTNTAIKSPQLTADGVSHPAERSTKHHAVQ